MKQSFNDFLSFYTVHSVFVLLWVKINIVMHSRAYRKQDNYNCMTCMPNAHIRRKILNLLLLPLLAVINTLSVVIISGVVVVERLERSLQFLFSRVERRSSSWFTSFLTILLTSCKNWHFNQIITGNLNYT